MTDQYKGPQSLADEVKLLFTSFDNDKNGTISIAELKEVLQGLDAESWPDDTVNQLLAGADSNGDGELQFTEFWSWINGHGLSSPTGRAKEQQKKLHTDLLGVAVEEDKKKWQEAKLFQEKREGEQAEKDKVEKEKRRKEAERESGERTTKKEFIEERAQIGISRKVANDMFAQGDEDGDGEIDKQELGFLASEQATTIQQIKGIFKQSHEEAGEEEIMDELVKTFSCWDEDGDGTVSCEELIRVIQTLNPRMGEKTAKSMIQQADTNGDGSIDIHEFLAWIAGLNPKKKKQKELHDAKLGLAIHMKRSAEAKELNLQAEFEKVLHESYATYATAKKIPVVCGTLNQAPAICNKKLCGECGKRHAWLCHGCGFVSYYDECVNDCGFGKFGWTCLEGECRKKGDGSKKKPDFWQRKGFVQNIEALSVSVKKMLNIEEKEEEVKEQTEEKEDA